MFDRGKVVQIVPDQIGKGGSKTAVHSHQAQPLLDTYYVKSVYVWNQRWRKERLASLLNPGTPQASISSTKAIHAYYIYSTANTNATPLRYVLVHNLKTNGHNAIWNQSSGASVVDYDAECMPATFTNIRNRCFIAWGGTQGLIYDGTSTYVIGAPATPTGIALYTITGGDAYTSNIYIAKGSVYVICQTIPPSPAWSAGDNGKRFVISGNTYFIDSYYDAAAFVPTGTLTNGANAYVGTVSETWQPNKWRGAMLKVGGVDQARVASYTSSGGVTTITFQTQVVAAHAGSAYTLAGSGFQLTTEGIEDNWSASGTIFPADSAGGSLTWAGTGPQYAIAPYDPTTGHIGNISPILTVTEEDQTGVSVTLSGFPTQASWEARFTKWKLFRSFLSGGNVLYPLTGYPGQPVDISATGPPGTWVDNYPDTTLAASGALAAPQTGARVGNDRPTVSANATFSGAVVCNGTPTVTYSSGTTFSQDFVNQQIVISGAGTYTVSAYSQPSTLTLSGSPAAGTRNYTVGPFVLYARPAHMAQWDGRIWMSPVQDPGLIVYSADVGQVTFGIAEECYPTGNALRIPAADGHVQGMRLVGNVLVITTDRYAYYVAGTNESNYRLMRLSTLMYGVGDYQMAELVSDGSQEQDGVVFLGRDKKLHIMAPNAGTTTISDPISDRFQDSITTLASYEGTRVHAGSVDDRRLVITRLPNECHIFDMERRNWHQAFVKILGSGTIDNVAPDCLATVYAASSSPIEELWGYQGEVGSWLSSTNSLATRIGSVAVFDTDFTARKSRKRLNFIRIYTSDDWNYSGTAGFTNASYNVTSISGTAFGSHLVGGVMNVNGTDYVITSYNSGTGVLTLDAPFAGTTGPFAWTMVQRWRYSVKVDDTTTYSDIFAAYSDPVYSLYPTNATPVDGAYAKELLWVPPNSSSTPSVDGILGFRFYVTVVFPDNYAPADLFRIDLCYSEEQPDGMAAL